MYNRLLLRICVSAVHWRHTTSISHILHRSSVSNDDVRCTFLLAIAIRTVVNEEHMDVHPDFVKYIFVDILVWISSALWDHYVSLLTSGINQLPEWTPPFPWTPTMTPCHLCKCLLDGAPIDEDDSLSATLLGLNDFPLRITSWDTVTVHWRLN